MSGSTKGMNSRNIDMSQSLDSNSLSQRKSIDLNTDSNEMNPASTGDEESPVSNSINRPTGRKKEKERMRKGSEMRFDINAGTTENEEIVEIIKKGQHERANDRSSIKELMKLKLENAKRLIDLKSAKQDHDIMMIDLNTIKGTPERQYFRQKKQAIMDKNIKKSLFHGSSSLEGTGYGGAMYEGSGYERSHYEGDQYRGPPFHEGQHGGSQYGVPRYGGSQYRESQYRENQYEGDQYGRPQSGGDHYGGSQYGGTQFGGNQHGGSQYGGNNYTVPGYEGEQHERSERGGRNDPSDDLPEY